LTAPAWLTRCSADVPGDDGWLGPRERAVLAGLRFPKRRDDWRLGRWTAKAAVSAHLGADPARIQILAAADGAPEAWVDGAPVGLSVSLSHRAGRAVAAVAAATHAVGCDLELVEPRSPAFVREWLAPREQALVAQRVGAERDTLANLLWSAREAAAKVRREGLRLDVRRAEVVLSGAGGGNWHRFSVRWGDDAPATSGWWRSEPEWVLTIAGGPALQPPTRLSAPP